jgi:tetratricopeptide (TPR) repeat protein
VDGRNHGEPETRAREAVFRRLLERELALLASGDPFVALDIGHDADDRAVRAAFLSATKRLHPNRFARASAPLRALAHEVYLRIKDAYLAIEQAEGRQRALARLGRASPAPVVGEGSGAVRQPVPNVPRVVLTPPGGTRLADVRPPSRPEPPRPEPPRPPTGPAVNGDEVRRQTLERARQVEEEFTAAVRKLEQGFAEIARREFHRLAVAAPGEKKYRVWLCYAKGRDHQTAGRLDEARAEYRRALDLDDRFAPARAALADLEPQGDRSPGSLFSRLFRK